MVKDDNLVIVNDDGTFWNGRRWVKEYPDAHTYRTQATAELILQTILSRQNVLASIVYHYGLDDERRLTPED